MYHTVSQKKKKTTTKKKKKKKILYTKENYTTYFTEGHACTNLVHAPDGFIQGSSEANRQKEKHV